MDTVSVKGIWEQIIQIWGKMDYRVYSRTVGNCGNLGTEVACLVG